MRWNPALGMSFTERRSRVAASWSSSAANKMARCVHGPSHLRLWPALVRLASRFSADRITEITEVHTERGHHVRSRSSDGLLLAPTGPLSDVERGL